MVRRHEDLSSESYKWGPKRRINCVGRGIRVVDKKDLEKILGRNKIDWWSIQGDIILAACLVNTSSLSFVKFRSNSMKREQKRLHCSDSFVLLTKPGENVTSKFRQYIKISISARDSCVRLTRWQDGRASRSSTEPCKILREHKTPEYRPEKEKRHPYTHQQRCSFTKWGDMTHSCLAVLSPLWASPLSGSSTSPRQHCNFLPPFPGDPEKMMKCTIFLGFQHFALFNGLQWELLLIHSGKKRVFVVVVAIVCPLLPQAGHELCAWYSSLAPGLPSVVPWGPIKNFLAASLQRKAKCWSGRCRGREELLWLRELQDLWKGAASHG